jgi:hypothetical protein
LLLDGPAARPKVSVILLDWGVRESFHSLHYLNHQTAHRDLYELIWVEFYDHEPAALRDLVQWGVSGHPALDRWVVLGHAPDTIFHKHRMYNVGIVASRGEVCVICDSDAMFRPTFIESILKAFRGGGPAALHIDQVRNNSPRFYPFAFPSFEEVEGDGAINWHGHATSGLLAEEDRPHHANMGACLAARREALIAVGGSDEHIDYLGYQCGPYDLTFRLCNQYRQAERWLADEFIHHTWHPNTSGVNVDYCGPHDGRGMSLRALHAQNSGRVQPYTRSPLIPAEGPLPSLQEALAWLASRPEPNWLADNAPSAWPDEAYFAAHDVRGWNLFCHKGRWFGLPLAEGPLDLSRLEAGGYLLLVAAESDVEARHTAIHSSYPGLGPLARLMRAAWREPLSRLPGRAWRKAWHVFGQLVTAVTG